MSGLIEKLEGNIIVDGETVNTTSIHWREKVAVVSQHSVFFNRSLRDNCLRDMRCDEDVLAALEKVKMKDRVMSLPGGLDTIIEGNGDTFSGGQRQRLRIARLLLGDRTLIFLDECTSAMDPNTTEEVIEVLRKFLVGKTVAMITHDMDTLDLAQRYLEMRPGGNVVGRRKESLLRGARGRKEEATIE